MNIGMTQINNLAENKNVQKCLQYLKETEGQTLKEQLDLTCIESPTGQEQERAEYILALMKAYGLHSAKIDGAGNVTGRLLGSEGGGCVLIEAHMDTVFPKGTVRERPSCVDGVINWPC